MLRAIYICDRCGREVMTSSQSCVTIQSLKGETVRVDLCADCRAGLDAFLADKP